MTTRTILNSTKNPQDHCLVMWSDENSVSIVPLSKIITPPSTKVTAACSCTIKGFEGFSSWVVAVGTKEEMMGLEKEFVASASPKDKPKEEEAVEPRVTTPTRTTKRGRKGATKGTPPAKKSKILKVLGKKRSPKKKKSSQPGRKGAIIVVGELLNSDKDSSSEKFDKHSTSKEQERSDDNPSTSKEPDISSVEQTTTPRTPSPVPKTPHRLISRPAHLSESSSDTSIEEIRTPSPVPKPIHRLIPSPADLVESSSDSSVEEVVIPRTPTPVRKPTRRLIPSSADLVESSSDSSVEEVVIPRTPTPVRKPTRRLIPSSAHVPTLETATPVTKSAHPREQYGALSFPLCDHDWYDNNLGELQPDAQQMAEGKDDQSDHILLELTIHEQGEQIFDLQQEVQMLKRTVQKLEFTIETISKKMERELLSRRMPQLPPQTHPGVPPNRPAPPQLNAGLLSAPTRSAPQNMALLSADTTDNLTASSVRPGPSTSFKSSAGVTISTPPTPARSIRPASSSSGASIRKPLTPLTNTGAKPSKAERPRLSSSEIKKKNLQSVDAVIKKYIKLAGKESSAGEFACKLAREAYFGIDVMEKCTCNGSGDRPGLPKAELLELKETVRQTFPKYMGTHEFEIVWSKCQTSLSQSCKRVRSSN